MKIRTEKIVGEEPGIIKKFVETVNRYDPDIVTGYNTEGYDFPLLSERAKKHQIEIILGRDKSALMSTPGRYWRIHGRLSVDVWLAAKRELRPKRETLGHIAKIVLGEKKLDVDPSKIDEEWEKNPEKVIDYCLKDAELALRILEKIAVIEKAMDLATVSKLPFDDVLNGRTSTLIDSILIREADRNRIGVPCTRHTYEGERITGGYVHSIQPGLYHWVVVMDFKSMYPSIIIANNICFTTLNPDGEIVSPTGVRFLSQLHMSINGGADADAEVGVKGPARAACARRPRGSRTGPALPSGTGRPAKGGAGSGCPTAETPWPRAGPGRRHAPTARR